MDTSGACPFCDFVDADSYFLIQHVELIHPEGGDSPFIVKDTNESSAPGNSSHEETRAEGTAGNASTSSELYVHCPHGCGEQILNNELSLHADFHLAERMAIGELDGMEEASIPVSHMEVLNDKDGARDNTQGFTTDLPVAQRHKRQSQSSSRRHSEQWSFREFLLGSSSLPSRQAAKKMLKTKQRSITRLGKAELGPYAHEEQMPTAMQRVLEKGGRVTTYNKIGPDGSLIRVESAENETPYLVSTLARLSELDPTVDRAFYCSSEVIHIAKLTNEGGFCGYRNIQMLVSYILRSGVNGYQYFDGKVPTILRLQDMIEQAWDMGFNDTGRIETGGIRGTRKYIGTPEAQALCQSLSIPCEANAFINTPDLPAYKALLLAVGEYFSNDASIASDQKIHMTSKSPIYFQHQGHSMTIVGIEMRRDPRTLNLVVFDPMYKVSPALLKLNGMNTGWRVRKPQDLLRAHRRGASYLGKYKEFELLKLTTRGLTRSNPEQSK